MFAGMATMKLDKQQEVQNAVAGDSISSVGVPVNVKEYAPSEVFTHEPPPAYKKPRATAVQIARIAAFTVISCTVILGVCIIAASWIEATASCSQFIHAEALLHHQQQKIIDEKKFDLIIGETSLANQDTQRKKSRRTASMEPSPNNDDVADRPSYQALVDPLQSDESSESKQESVAATAPSQPPLSQHREPSSQSQSAAAPIQIKLPLQLDFDEIAGSLMEKNQRSRMNCVVEKKSAEEVTDHQPKTVRLPFGVNITTDPRYEHITGERMAIYCESGHDQRHLPMEQMQPMQPQPQHHAPVVVPMPMNLPMMMAHASHHPNSIPNHHHNSMPSPSLSLSQFNQMSPISMASMASMAAAMPPQEDASSAQKEDGPITIIAREEHVIPIFQPVVPDMRPLSSNFIVEGGRSAGAYNPMAAASQARAMPESRMLHTFAIPENRQPPLPIFEARSSSASASPHNGPMPAIPSEIVRPPPPPAFHKIPIHVPTVLQQVENQQQTLNENVLEEEVESDPRPHYVQPRSVRSVDSQLHQSAKRTRRYACSCTC